MALASTAAWRVIPTGSDTLCSAYFNFNATASISDIAVSNANTSTPTISSATFPVPTNAVGANFVLKSGTGATLGSYPITAVNAGTHVATLDAAIGHATNQYYQLNTVVGCGTSASLTNCTGMIDYTPLSAAVYSPSDLNTAGISATVTSAAAGFLPWFQGNGLYIATSGTGGLFTVGIYEFTTYNSTTSYTMDRNVATGIGVNAQGYVGGANAYPGRCGASAVASNALFIKGGSTYAYSTATQNVAGGPPNWPAGATGAPSQVIGYTTYVGDNGQPTVSFASNPGSATQCIQAGANSIIKNFIAEGSNFANARGLSGGSTNTCYIDNCKSQNCNICFSNCILQNSGGVGSANTTKGFVNAGGAYNVVFKDCTDVAIEATTGGVFERVTIIGNNANASQDGIRFSGAFVGMVRDFTIVGMGRYGINVSAGYILASYGVIYDSHTHSILTTGQNGKFNRIAMDDSAISGNTFAEVVNCFFSIANPFAGYAAGSATDLSLTAAAVALGYGNVQVSNPNGPYTQNTYPWFGSVIGPASLAAGGGDIIGA